MNRLSRALIDRSPSWLRRPVAVAVRTGHAAGEDRLGALAAEIAFWVLLSLPALLVTAIAAVGFIATVEGADWQQELVDRIADALSIVLTTPTIDEVVIPLVEQLLDAGGVGLISFGFLTALWAASRAVKVVVSTVTLVYDGRQRRQGWQDRLLGFGITLGALVASTVLAPLLLTGPNFIEVVQGWVNADLGLVDTVWRIAYWPVVALMVPLALTLLYHLAIPGRSRWRHEIPGALLAAAAWVAGSIGLRIYGVWLAEGGSAYGPLAGPIVALLWLWWSGFAVLLGAELNAQLEHSRAERTSTPEDEALTAASDSTPAIDAATDAPSTSTDAPSTSTGAP